jgi:hypothetical protein
MLHLIPASIAAKNALENYKITLILGTFCTFGQKWPLYIDFAPEGYLLELRKILYLNYPVPSHISFHKIFCEAGVQVRVTWILSWVIHDLKTRTIRKKTTQQTFVSSTFGLIEGNLQLWHVLVTAKKPNLPSFFTLSLERKVRLTCSWSHFVGLIEPEILDAFAKHQYIILIFYKPKTFKFGMVSFKLLLMPINSLKYQLALSNPRLIL